jgi:hypothetical protein
VTAQYDLAKTLLDAVYDELPQDRKPGRSCVVPGVEAAWDDCCDGQLAVIMPNVYASETFPGAPGGGSSGCGATYLVQNYAIELVRCTATVDEQGNPPTCDQLDVDAQRLSEDAHAVRRAIFAVLDANDGNTFLDYRVLDQPSLGPTGGCAGSRLSISIGFNGEGCD